MTRIQSMSSLIIVVACFQLTQIAHAAVITAVQDLTPTEAEVQNQNINLAVNLGENQDNGGPGYASAVIVNGVNFVPLSTALPGDSTPNPLNETFTSSQGSIQILTTARGFTAFRASDFDNSGTSDLLSPLSTLYDSLIAGNNTGGVDIELNLSSLSVGSSYRLQLYLASGNQTNRIIDILQNGSTLLATYNNTTPHGEIIDLIWNADQPTEQIILRGNVAGSGVPVLSGFSLSSTTPPVPEPNSFLLLGLGTLALGRYTRRRRTMAQQNG